MKLRIGDICIHKGVPYWILLIINDDMIKKDWSWLKESGVWGLCMQEPSTVDYIPLSLMTHGKDIEISGHQPVHECHHKDYLHWLNCLKESEAHGGCLMPHEIVIDQQA